MGTTILLVIVLVGIAFVLLAIQILFKKNGSFPKTHIEDNEFLKKQGIHCASHDEYECSASDPSASACESCSLTCPVHQQE
jgi:hypothetical protein